MTDVLDILNQAASSASTDQPDQSQQQPQQAAPDVLDILNNAGAYPDPVESQNVSSPGVVKTAFDQGLQGATFGLGDKISDVIGAGIASGYTGGKFSDFLNQSRDQTKQDMSSEMANHPVVSLGSQLAGGVLTGNAIGDAVEGTSIANFLKNGQVAKNATLSAKAGNLALNTGKGALLGAVGGAAYGAGSAENVNDIVPGAESGAKFGGIVGGALPAAGAVTNAIKNTVVPSVSDMARDAALLAQKHGIPLALDQLAGSHARDYLSATSSEVPYSGGPQFAAKQQAAFNNAILNTVGESGDKITPDVVDDAYKNIGQKFDDILAGKTLQVSPDHLNDLDNIVQNASGSLANDKVAAIQKTIDNIKANISPDGTISGEKIGDIRSTLSQQIKRADPGIKDYLGDVMDKVMDISTDGNPEAKQQLTQAKYQYKNLKTLEPLFAKATDGNVSPALLKNRVIQNYGAKSMATGNAGDLGDLVRVGDLIKGKIGNSGTAQRAASMALLATPGAIIGGATTPGDYAHRALGAVAGAATSLAAAKGYQSYNNSGRLAAKAISGMSAAQVAKLPPGVIAGLIGNQIAGGQK